MIRQSCQAAPHILAFRLAVDQIHSKGPITKFGPQVSEPNHCSLPWLAPLTRDAAAYGLRQLEDEGSDPLGIGQSSLIHSDRSRGEEHNPIDPIGPQGEEEECGGDHSTHS